MSDELCATTLEKMMEQIWGMNVRIVPTKLYVADRHLKIVRKLLGRTGIARYRFLQRKGARPKGCRS